MHLAHGATINSFNLVACEGLLFVLAALEAGLLSAQETDRCMTFIAYLSHLGTTFILFEKKFLGQPLRLVLKVEQQHVLRRRRSFARGTQRNCRKICDDIWRDIWQTVPSQHHSLHRVWINLLHSSRCIPESQASSQTVQQCTKILFFIYCLKCSLPVKATIASSTEMSRPGRYFSTQFIRTVSYNGMTL